MLDHVVPGMQAVFLGAPAFELLGLPVSMTVVMVVVGFLGGIVVGATPGLAGPFAMAIALPILISVFGVHADALLPVLGFLVGVMKGATVGGAVPAILFNTPGTPDALTTTYDGYPMAQAGKSGKALRVAHLSSAAGDTWSDLVLFLCAPFLAVLIERHLGFPEKTALILLSLAFVAVVVGRSPARGLLSALLGMLAAVIATGEDLYPRLSLEIDALADGSNAVAAVIGVLVIGSVFAGLEDLWRERRSHGRISPISQSGDNRLRLSEVRRLLPYIVRSAAVGTVIGALPGIGTTLAATLGYAWGRRRHRGRPAFGEGAMEGVAATEAANSAVSGANLIPVLSLGIPGNTAAVFLILAADSIGGFNPGPSVFSTAGQGLNPELVIVFGLFTTMVIANLLNWTVGSVFMRNVAVVARVPRQILLPTVLLLTCTSIYVQDPEMLSIVLALIFGLIGYVMIRLEISLLPFVVAFILTGRLESLARQSFQVTGGDPWFLLSQPVAATLTAIAVIVVVFAWRRRR